MQLKEVNACFLFVQVIIGYFLDFFLWVFNVSIDFGTKPYEIKVLNNILWNEIK